MSEETREEKLQRMNNFVKLVSFVENSDTNETGEPEPALVTKLKQLKSKIYNKKEPIPIGDIHGDSQLFLAWMLLSGAATIDQENPIIEYITENVGGENVATDIFNLRPNPNFRGNLIFLGDYIDRGSDSQNILISLTDFLKKQKSQGLQNVIPLLGNHEIRILENPESALTKEELVIKKELEENLQLFKLLYVKENNVYAHTNPFSNEVYSVVDKGRSYRIDDYILRKMRYDANNDRIEQIRESRDFGKLVSQEDTKTFSSILDFYKRNRHTKNGIKKYVNHVNDLLAIFKKDTNHRTKNTALAFMKSLSSVRAKVKSQAEYLSGTEMVLYKGHDVGAESGEHVKNMDMGGSCCIKKLRGKTTDFYLGEDEEMISLEAFEINEATKYLEEIKNKTRVRRHVRGTQNSVNRFDDNRNKENKTVILETKSPVQYSDKTQNSVDTTNDSDELSKKNDNCTVCKQPRDQFTHQANEAILTTKLENNKHDVRRHVRRTQNFVDRFGKEREIEHRNISTKNNNMKNTIKKTIEEGETKNRSRTRRYNFLVNETSFSLT